MDWTTLVIIIALVGSLSWIPVVVIVSLVQNGKRRFQTSSKDEEKKDGQQHPKQPEIQKPPPILAKGLERSASTRTHGTASTGDPLKRWDTGSSWDPVKRWDSSSTYNPPSKHSSLRSNSNFSRPPLPEMLTSSLGRASSIRSVASLQKENWPGYIPAAHRRWSINNIVGVSPRGEFQVEKAYYDTTPLPETPVPRAANFARPMPPRTHSRASSVTSRPVSFEAPRTPPGRPSGDFSRPRPSIDEQLCAPQPRRVSVNSQLVQTMQQVQEEQAPWWDAQAARLADLTSPPLGQAM